MSNQSTLKHLPQLLRHHFSQSLLFKHVICTIGYGSALFPQTAKLNATNTNAIDVIMIVKNNYAFHRDMYEFKSWDYAGLPKWVGPNYLYLLNKYVYPVHFNHVEVFNVKLKYAVVDLLTFLYDLKTWRMLTFAGRMHKPVLFNIINQISPLQLIQSVKLNHKMALSVGLLNLIGKTSLTHPIPLDILYKSISNISYTGDIRQTLSIQNTKKVNNIVQNNREAFGAIYQPLIKQLIVSVNDGSLQIVNQKQIIIKYTPKLINKLVAKDHFPEVLHSHFLLLQNSHNDKTVFQTILKLGLNQTRIEITEQLSKINKKSSIRMACQNFLGASPANNIKYIINKIRKKKY